MLTLTGYIVLISFTFILIGAVPAGWITEKIAQEGSRKGPINLAIALVIGFAASSLAATWSFGAFGADSYLIVLTILAAISAALIAIKVIRKSIGSWSEFSIKDLFLVTIPLLAVYLVKPYWTNMKDLQIVAGQGPDIPQNLMTALAQPNVGATWFEGKDKFLSFVSSPDLAQGVYHLYQLPSMQQQAGFDYLIYGTRWGLSIPFAQLLRINPELLLAGQGISIAMGLVALAFVMYAFGQIMKLRPTIAVILTIISISSSGFLFQAYNGGMAQAWGLPGLAALSLGFFLAIYFAAKQELTKEKQIGIAILMVFGWLGNAITYIDSSMILAGAFGLACIFLFFVAEHQIARKSLILLVSSGLLAAVLAAPYAFAALQTMSIRLKLAAGTGLIFAHWPLPSEILGLFNVWTQNDGKPRDGGVILAGILLTGGILWVALKGITSKLREEKTLSYLAASILLLCGFVALWAKNTKLGSNYSYVKVSTYLSPLLLMIIGYKLISVKKLNIKKRDNKFGLIGSYITPSIYLAIALFSTFDANANMLKNAQYVVPAAQMSILADEKAQEELSEYNYLTTYLPVSNILGIMGDVNWVGKAPNDQILDERMDKEMRVICFNADRICQPKSNQIANSTLDKYGFRLYESTIDTKSFSNLKPLDRYYAAMDATGQPRFEVPERFIGGNPLLK